MCGCPQSYLKRWYRSKLRRRFACIPAQGKELWDASSQPTPNYAAQTVSVMGQLAQRYANASALLGFGLLNQPTVRRLSNRCVATQPLAVADLE